MPPAERIARAVEFGAAIHPQYKAEFENGVAVAWHRVPFTLGCAGDWTEQTRAEHYDNLCQIDGRIVLAGEHASYIPAWQEGAILSSLDAITRLHRARGQDVKRSVRHDSDVLKCRIVGVAAWLGALSLLSVAAHAQSAPQPSLLSPGFRFSETSGEELFTNVCQGCHMPDGKGAAGAGTYPSLARQQQSRSPRISG